MKDPHRYDDMLHLPHHQSKNHPQMSRYNRAAQFSPFAALTGYESSIAETARLTDCRIDLDENAKSVLDTKFLMIMEHINEHQELEFTYFTPDLQKEGGAYHSIFGIVKKINMTARTITLYACTNINTCTSDGTVIDIDQIVDIQGDLFKSLEV